MARTTLSARAISPADYIVSSNSASDPLSSRTNSLFDGTTSGLAQFGMLHSLRTGNIILDMFLCMLIPVLFSLLRDWHARLGPLVDKLWELMRVRRIGGEFYRQIESTYHASQAAVSFNSNVDDQSSVLQRAISSYISDKIGFTYHEGIIALVNPKSTFAIGQSGNGNNNNEDDGSLVSQIKHYRLMTSPPLNTWVELPSGVFFKHSKSVTQIQQNNSGFSNNNASMPQNITICFQFYAKGVGAQKRVETFVEDAFQWYQKLLKSQETNTRYMYTQIPRPSLMSSFSHNNNNHSNPHGNQNGGFSSSIIYQRYALSEDKTFESVFLPEKKQLLTLLQQFQEKQGKFAVRGYPHRLGLLLHGPPGTGKTSLIKALAQHTRRHVVAISLSQVQTNRELYDIIFSQSFNTGGIMPYRHKYDQLIFVMEDIDCANKIVLKRDLQKKAKEESNCDSDDESLHSKKINKDKLNQLISISSDANMQETKTGLVTVSGPSMSSYYKKSLLEELEPDTLNLAGLLNVLDGIVDCPNRILIMTTNHPEKLDPALIRPGRINLELHLSYITLDCTIEMLQLYFGKDKMTEPVKKQIAQVFGSALRQFTPAEIEQLCVRHDQIQKFVDQFAILAKKPRDKDRQ